MKQLSILLVLSLFMTTAVFAQKKSKETKAKQAPATTSTTESSAHKTPNFKIRPKVGELRDIEFPSSAQRTDYLGGQTHRGRKGNREAPCNWESSLD